LKSENKKRHQNSLVFTGLIQASLLLLFIYAFILHRIRGFVNKNTETIYKIKFQRVTDLKINVVIKKIKFFGNGHFFTDMLFLL